MRRTLAVIVFITILLVSPGMTVHAEDTMFTTIRLSKILSTAVRIGNAIGFDIGGLIIPSFNKEPEEAIPNHQATAAYKSRFTQWLTPQNYLDDGKHIPWNAKINPVIPFAFYGAFLRADAEYSDHPEDTECIISEGVQESEPILFLPVDGQKAVEPDSWVGLGTTDPNEDGIVDFNKKTKLLTSMNPGEDCKKHNLGVAQKPIENGITTLTSFDESKAVIGGQMVENKFNWIIEIINGVEQRTRDFLNTPNPQLAVVIQKRRVGNLNCISHDAGGPGNEMGDCSGESDKTGGWTKFLIPDGRDTPPAEDAAMQEYKLDIGYKGRRFGSTKGEFSTALKNQQEVYLKRASCYVSPDTSNTSYDDVRKSLVMGGVLPAVVAAAAGISEGENVAADTIDIYSECEPPAPACSTTELPELKKISGSCGVCNAKSLNGNPNLPVMSGTIPDNGLPQTLIDIVSNAADAFEVPAASILSVMYHEGAFNRDWFTGGGQWTDENVKKWSVCGGALPNTESEFSDGLLCDPKKVDYATCGPEGPNPPQCSKSIAGFGFLPHWFWSGSEGSNANWDAVRRIDPTRTRETISPCNVLDAAFATASELSHGAAFVPPAVTSPTCFDVPMNNTTIPGSCAAWTEQQIFQSHVTLAGYCPEPGKNSIYPPQPKYKDWTLGVYNAFKCGGP